jgi:hypothetical protein
MLTLFGVTVVLYFMKILSGSRNYNRVIQFVLRQATARTKEGLSKRSRYRILTESVLLHEVVS